MIGRLKRTSTLRALAINLVHQPECPQCGESTKVPFQYEYRDDDLHIVCSSDCYSEQRRQVLKHSLVQDTESNSKEVSDR